MFLIDFFLEFWLLFKGYIDFIDLFNYVVFEFFYDFDIVLFLNDVDCNRRLVFFYLNIDGWNKGELK